MRRRVERKLRCFAIRFNRDGLERFRNDFVNALAIRRRDAQLLIELHPPLIIFLLLALLTLGASFLAGHAMAAGKSRHWIHAIAFCVAMATTVYVILDIEYPLLGFIRIDSVNQTLVELRQSMSARP